MSQLKTANFKVDNVDTLNTHLMQLISGGPLAVQPKTAEALAIMIGLRFEDNELTRSREFVITDGSGGVLANFSKAMRKTTTLKQFLEAEITLPDEQSFAHCDKVIKCTKVHQQCVTHTRIAAQHYTFGGYSKLCPIPLFKNKVAKQGFCFSTLLLALSYFVTKEFDEEYSNIVKEATTAVGIWPTLGGVSKVCKYIISKIPILAPVPIPAVAVNHEKKLVHICDQRGIPEGWHQLKMGTLAEIASSGTFSESPLVSYLVGGDDLNEDNQLYVRGLTKVKSNLKKWITQGTMMEDCTRDMDLAAFLMLSPSMLGRLRNLIEIESDTALKLVTMEANCANKVVVATAIRTAIQGVIVHVGESKLEKIWLNVNNILQDQLSAEGKEMEGSLSRALHRLHAHMMLEKKLIFSYERRLYAMTQDQFKQEFGCSYGWGSRLHFNMFRKNGNIDVGKQSFSLRALDDGITHRTIERMNEAMMFAAVRMVYLMANIFSVARFFMLLFMTIFGCMSLSKFLFHCAKALLMRRLAHNWERLVIITMVFLLYELARFVINKKAQREALNAAKGIKLEAAVKSSEKQMMAAMAMMTLVVHAFDMDLALTMSSALNHVARLANMLTDTTSGWLSGGGAHQELQMQLFEVALEVDDQQATENEAVATSTSAIDTFSSWINESVACGVDNTRTLSYGDLKKNRFELDSQNGAEIGAQMANTNRAWTQVIGATGSGKSTRVPLGYYNAIQGMAGRRRNILICEPTQATTQNVAAALSHFHGKTVYYKHEGKEQLGDMSIQVMTYGSAFYRGIHNPTFLNEFDAVFLDESHQISAHSLSLEALLNKQTTVRKFYLSATPRDGTNCDTVQRRFQIFEHKVERCDTDQFLGQLKKKTNVDPMQYGSKVLVFLSGKAECDRSASRINSTQLGIKAISLHKDNFKTNYNKVVQLMETDAEVIVFATNILETGVTLNVDVVVDFGFTNSPVLDLVGKTFLLNRRRVTQAERKQRIGRAGRLRNGHAIMIGNVGQAEEIVPADVVYEAALLSFVHNLDIFINSHFDSAWLGTLTRRQAMTMLEFRLPSFATKDLVFSDGSVRKEVLECLKGHTKKSTNIKTVDGCVINHVHDAWPVLGTFCQKFGVPFEDDRYGKLSRMKVPFIFHEMGSIDLEAFTEAVATYRPTMLTRWAKPSKEVANVIMHVNSKNVFEVIGAARALIASTKQQISAKRHSQTINKESPLLCFFTKASTLELESKLGEQIRKGERNVEKLIKFVSKLELFANMHEIREDDIELTSAEMEQIGRALELQMETTCNESHISSVLHLEELPSTTFREAIIIGKKKVACALGLMCIAAFGGLAWHYLWDDDEGMDNKWNKANKRSVLKEVLEMKGKSFNRDKRSAAAYEHILSSGFDDQTNEDLRTFQSKRKGKKQKEATAFENLMNKKSPFITMYDVTSDENVVNAVFMDANKQAFYETGNPLANMAHVKEHLAKLKEGSPIGLWSDEADETIYCDVTQRDGTTIRVRLTPHVSTRLTATHGRQGFASKEGEYRQTGDAEILNQGPSEKLEIDTRLPGNQININAGSMVGYASLNTGGVNCILYKDWIIMPAHAMMSSFPITIKFQHYTCTIATLPECYGFIGYDLIIIRKPSTLKPTKCLATVDVAKDGMIVQMLYKKRYADKAQMTITAEAYQNKKHQWEHQIPTAEGMCGCPVFDASTGKIVGIHILGNERKKCNVFESIPGDAMRLLNTNDPKCTELYIDNKIKTWNFTPELHGHNSADIKNLQSEGVTFRTFSRDTSIYTIENMLRSASGGGFFKPRDVSEPKPLPPTISALHMRNLAYANGLLNTRHIFEGENPYWKQFKLCNPWAKDVVAEYEDKYAPSALNRDAYWKDLLKYNRPLHRGKVNEEALKAATIQVIKILKESGMKETRIATVDEVLDDVQWRKAAGPLYGMKKKELCERANMSMEDLTAFAIHCKSELKRGHNAGVWNGSLKAELRPIEKVNANKTRVFTAAPITTLIGAKFFVDDFNKQFYATHLKAPHTVGINKFQNGWAKVHEKLNVKGWLHGSGDGSRFDSSIDPFLFDMIYTIRCHMMRDEDKREAQQAMSHMFREFVFTPMHTISGNIIMKQVGNNSGQPSTVVDNTLVLMLSFYYAYAIKTNDFDFSEIDKRFKFVCNGDDNKFSVSPQFVEEFGGTFTDEIQQLGLNYEFDDLTPDITRNPYMSLTMIQINAKIGFQLNPERIVGIVQWIKKGGVVHATQAAFAAMVEAFNDPELFVVLHTYLVWLLRTYRDVLIFAMHNEMVSICYMDPCQVYALHYGSSADAYEDLCYESDDSEDEEDENYEPYLTLQMDNQTLESQRKAREDRQNERKRELDELNKISEGERTEEQKARIIELGKSESEDEVVTNDSNEGSPNNGEDEADVPWVMPKFSNLAGTTAIPVINGKKVWKRAILRNIPKQQFDVASNKATHTQLTAWVEAVKKNLQVRDDDGWSFILSAWCIWCANNGTSSETDSAQKVEFFDGLGKASTVQAKVFIDPAKENGGLRKIMRHFSGITQDILEKGGVMTAWGMKRGFTDRAMIPYAFDYCVTTLRESKVVREHLAQAKASAIGRGTMRAMILDGKINGMRTSYERHLDTDTDEYEHGSSDSGHPHLT